MLRVAASSILIGFAVSCVAFVSSTVFLHRGLAHRAVTFKRPVTEIFRMLVWITTGIKPRQWVAVHRKHHAYSDEPGDPHSPKLLGWRRVQIGNVGLYRKVANDPAQVQRYARDLPADGWDRALFDRAW